MANISAVYISHLHADHHIGLIGLLQGRRRAFESLNEKPVPFYLFAPIQILTWLNFYDGCLENIKDDFILVPNAELVSLYLNVLYKYKYLDKNVVCESLRKLCLHKYHVSHHLCFIILIKCRIVTNWK